MIDLAGYDMTAMSARLRGLRLARDFAQRQALLEAVDSAAAFQAANRPAAPLAKPARGSQKGVPYSGPAPISRADAPSLADEEWSMRRAGAATGGRPLGAPAATGSALIAPSSVHTAKAATVGGARAQTAPSRPAEVRKAGLASGSQAAVVKLASYGAGSVRAASLLNYQSDKGQLSLEREDGTLVTGQAAVADLASHWREENEREPSNDVFRIAIELDGTVTADAVRDALSTALKGHHFAWRLEEGDQFTTIHLVAVAAGAGRDEYGKRERIYANEKSLGHLHDQIEDAFGRDAEFSKPTWAHGVDGATTQLAALSKAGQLPAETDKGLTIQEVADRQFEKRPSAANRAKPANFNPNLQLAKAWQPAMRSSGQRDFAHVILSAKPGTDKVAFMDAARATLGREFAGHEYVFVMHTNRQHIHVHAAVRLTSPTGQKLHPGIQDFNRWRETLAEEARERRIPMEAVRRFDQAHTPAYKLKDVKMVERGIAPPSVRRRIERVQNREIHRPTREEGRKRATEAASQWKSLASRQKSASLPNLAPGAVRLYRAEAAKTVTHRAALFTNERAVAESYIANSDARLLYIDVPSERLSEIKASRENPTNVFVVSPSLSSLIKPVILAGEAAILPFQRRAEAALTAENKDRRSAVSEDNSMRNAATMDAAKQSMADAMSRIGGYLPEGALKDDLTKRSRDILGRAEEATRAQSQLDGSPADIEGNRFVQPEPAQNLGALITHERKGAEIHYSRRDATTGAYQTLAFIDRGKQLDVKDWTNPDSINAALRVAADKWDTITVNGSDAYKETAARLAAEHGYKITNPEMQDLIRELRTEIETQRATVTEGKAQTNAKQQSPIEPVKADDKPQTENDPAKTPRGSEPSLNTTPAERSIELASIRECVDVEATRETQQAARAATAHETNAATGSEATPYRSPEEARTAREAERAVESNPSQPIPADPTQSEAIQSLRHEQSRVLGQAERDQRKIDIENAEKLRRQERQPEGKEEAEGESM